MNLKQTERTAAILREAVHPQVEDREGAYYQAHFRVERYDLCVVPGGPGKVEVVELRVTATSHVGNTLTLWMGPDGTVYDHDPNTDTFVASAPCWRRQAWFHDLSSWGPEGRAKAKADAPWKFTLRPMIPVEGGPPKTPTMYLFDAEMLAPDESAWLPFDEALDLRIAIEAERDEADAAAKGAS